MCNKNVVFTAADNAAIAAEVQLLVNSVRASSVLTPVGATILLILPVYGTFLWCRCYGVRCAGFVLGLKIPRLMSGLLDGLDSRPYQEVGLSVMRNPMPATGMLGEAWD